MTNVNRRGAGVGDIRRMSRGGNPGGGGAPTAVAHVSSNSGTGSGSTITGVWGATTTAGNCGVCIFTFGNNTRSVDQQMENPPAGWRLHRVMEAGNGTPGHTSYIYVKPNLSASESDPVFTRTAGSDINCWWIGEYENVDLGKPIRTFRNKKGDANPATGTGQETQRAGSLAIVGFTLGDNWTSGTFSDGTYTSRAELSTTNLGLIVYDKEFATAGSTGAPTWDRTSTNDAYRKFNIILQPARAAVTADIKTHLFKISSPTSGGDGTGVQTYTDPGFQVKAIRIWSIRTNDDNLTINSEFSLGYAADDGDTAKTQGVVGFWHDEGVATERGYSDDTMCIKHYATTETGIGDNTWAASFTSVASGFELDWTKVGSNSQEWLVECWGGEDYRGTVGIGDLSLTASPTLPWRPDAVDFASQCIDALTTPQIRSNSMLSFGWATEAGETACYCQDYDPNENFVLRNLSFIAQVDNSNLSYEAQIEKFTDDGFTWFNISGDTSDEFFFLAHNWGGGERFNPGEYRCQLDVFKIEDDIVGSTQDTPPFDDGNAKRTLMMLSSSEPSTDDNFSNAVLSQGAARIDPDDDSVEFQNVFSTGTQGRTISERKRTNTRIFYGTPDGNMGSATNRVAVELTDFDTLTLREVGTTDILVAMMTFGPPGDGIP